jgi:taurine dioxygenase
MTLKITPFSAGCGARVDGLNLHAPLDADTIATIRDAWLEHIVLVFPGDELTLEEQRRFASYFGKVGERARPRDARPEGTDYDAGFMLVSNIRDAAGKPIGSLPDGEMWFHHDTSYTREPHKATFLHALDIPGTGGHTLFADMYKAYENIPDALKARLAGRRVLHVYDFTLTERLDPDGDLTGIKHEWQPLFIRHPESGRIALYANRLMAARIEGLSRAESDEALETLFAIAEDPAIVYEHVWTKGDLVMWDNRCSIHARTDFPASERRRLRRCTIEGGPMVAAEPAAA